jgi:hypothetical protein
MDISTRVRDHVVRRDPAVVAAEERAAKLKANAARILKEQEAGAERIIRVQQAATARQWELIQRFLPKFSASDVASGRAHEGILEGLKAGTISELEG